MSVKFTIDSDFEPKGDQPQAIIKLAKNIIKENT